MNIKRMVFSPIGVNTYIVDDGKGRCAVIDCGCYTVEEFQTLRSYMDEMSIKPVILLNTHMHLDHIFGNAMFLEEYGLLTCASAAEEDNRMSATMHAKMFGLSMEEPPPAGRIISEGEEVTMGDIVFRALFVPGHTAGSIAWYVSEHKVVFSGDALFAGSVGRSDLPGGDHDRLIKSIKSELLSLDDDTLVYPGHGNDTTIAYEKENNPYLK